MVLKNNEFLSDIEERGREAGDMRRGRRGVDEVWDQLDR